MLKLRDNLPRFLILNHLFDLQVLTVFFIFIIAFALAFFVLLGNQTSFAKAAPTLAKTFVMMTGEYDFDVLFRGGCDTSTPRTCHLPPHALPCASALALPALFRNVSTLLPALYCGLTPCTCAPVLF